MAPVTSADGPVAVTGAAGVIGSWVVRNLVEHGYTVRACVRDESRRDKTEHLAAMNGKGVGSVKIFSADMTVEGAYDSIFAGCSAVFHLAAELAADPAYGPVSPSKEYSSLVNSMQNVLKSLEKSGSVKRLIYTSSTAALWALGQDGYDFTEADWAGPGDYESIEKRWGQRWSHEKDDWFVAYCKGKVVCERMAYDWGREKGIDVISCLPGYGVGPLLCKAHFVHWQRNLGLVFAGAWNGDMHWNLTDVRDLGEAQRLMAESRVAVNGSRYMVTSPVNDKGEMTASELTKTLKELFPTTEGIGGKGPAAPNRNSQNGKARRAERELGLRFHIVKDTLQDTITSLQSFGCIDDIRRFLAARAQKRDKAASKL